MKKFLIVSIISLTLILPFTTSAYYESPGPGDLRANVYPANPGIEQKTSISLASYLLNLDTCDITWKQNDIVVQEGTGQKSLAFTTGKLGQTVSVSTALNCPNSEPMTKDWLFQTNDVEFLVTADTYTPPFYRGNNRVSPKSSVKIVAFPQVFNTTGELIKSETLIYNWTKDGKAMPISSGYGKNTLTVQANEMPGTVNYAVTISSLTEEIKVNKSVTIVTENPQLILYENKPLLGLQYQKGLGNLLNLTENETTLTAEPFFFSNSDLASDNLVFNWAMNNKSISASSNGRSVTLRQTAGQTGEATISLQVNNPANVFSTAQKVLTVNFGQKTSLFGF